MDGHVVPELPETSVSSNLTVRCGDDFLSKFRFICISCVGFLQLLWSTQVETYDNHGSFLESAMRTEPLASDPSDPQYEDVHLAGPASRLNAKLSWRLSPAVSWAIFGAMYGSISSSLTSTPHSLGEVVVQAFISGFFWAFVTMACALQPWFKGKTIAGNFFAILIVVTGTVAGTHVIDGAGALVLFQFVLGMVVGVFVGLATGTVAWALEKRMISLRRSEKQAP
jgi:hypothetical protein